MNTKSILTHFKLGRAIATLTILPTLLVAFSAPVYAGKRVDPISGAAKLELLPTVYGTIVVCLHDGQPAEFDPNSQGLFGGPACFPGDSLRIRNLPLTSQQIYDGNDPGLYDIVSGTKEALFNAELDAYGRGPVWATWKLQSLSGDIFEGVGFGQINGANGARIQIEGFGTSSDVKGMRVKAVDNLNIDGSDVYEDFFGYLVRPGKKYGGGTHSGWHLGF